MTQPRNSRAGLASVLVGSALATLAGGAAAADKPAPDIRAFKPVADSYVTATRPRVNFGRARTLRVDGSPEATAYLRFRLTEREDIGSVTLLLHADRAARVSYAVRRVDRRDWKERRLNFRNAPPVSPRYAASRPVRRGAWNAIDVTSFVEASGNDVSLAITTRASQQLTFGSRESSHGPRLVVRYGDDDGSPFFIPGA